MMWDTGRLILDPLLPWPVLAVLAGVAVLAVALALSRGLAGWGLRGLAAVAILAALANPSWQTEDRQPLSDIVVVLVDDTASQRLGDRAEQTEAALAALQDRLGRLGGVEMRLVRVPDAEDDGGTRAMTALASALADLPNDRIAGVFALTDGQVHDMAQAPDLPAPFHTLLTGRPEDWDRRVVIVNAPSFAILGEPVQVTLRIEDQGAVPRAVAGRARLRLALNGGEVVVRDVPVGEDIVIPLVLERGGVNVLQAEVAVEEGELTDRNNAAILRIDGVRDRLRVLLVSGEPHAGERTWRNLLRSDASVDLVHFTILRPPDRQDGVPVSELSLIAFPTRELFIERIDDFDLIIFDRYRRRGILPASYFENIRRYVVDGGAVLIAGGPELADAGSLWRSPLGGIFPGIPTARVFEEGFHPRVTDLGQRHPVTRGLGTVGADGTPPWGRWFRHIDLEPQSGQVVMSGVQDRPLLILDRVGDGRIALLASDHAWLWSRGYEGGGPQLELLRRLAHWMMGEPDLEEETLTATAAGQRITVLRRTLDEAAEPVEIEGPDGVRITLDLSEIGPGEFAAEWDAPEIGLYRLADDALDAVVAVGPSAPREFEETIASAEPLRPLVEETRGGVARVVEGIPDIRAVAPGRPAAGRGWLAITPRDAAVTTDLRLAALLPGWAWLLLAASLVLAGWLREGRR